MFPDSCVTYVPGLYPLLANQGLVRARRSAASRLALGTIPNEHHCHALNDCPAAERQVV